MKKYIFLLLFFGLSFSACDENMPVIDCLSCDDEQNPPPPPESKRVLIEEFTGVRCINCPAGSIELENLLSQFGESLVAVSIHAEFFANPYSESNYDFRTDEGEEIINFLGLPEAYPSAVIDRKQFSGESDLQLVGQASWPGRISQQVDEMAKISLVVENEYNSTSRDLSVNVVGQVQENVNEEVRLTIMITESGIVDAQLTPDSSPDLDLNYVHKHVLRNTLTAFDGDVLASSLVAGAGFDKTYTYTLPEAWDATKCTVIAFVHLAESSKEVLQTTEVSLAD